MKIKFDNWRDQRGSELEQAKKVVSDKNISLVVLSKLTKIPYATIRVYRQDLSKLDRASWENINRLGQAYDIASIENVMTQEDMKEYPKKLAKMFKNWSIEAINKNQDVAVIQRMKEIILSDPLAVAELFKAEKKS